MRVTIPVLAILVTIFIYVKEKRPFESNYGDNNTNEIENSTFDESQNAIVTAFKNGSGDLQVHCKGTITKILPDDTKGSRHQRFLIELENKHSLLIAHNIDLAPRAENIKEGDIIVISGEYEWNDKGGVIHWTHKDPDQKHADGWLKHNGIVYE